MSMFVSPAKAIVGSLLTVPAAGLSDAPIIATLAIPALILGVAACIQGSLPPIKEEAAGEERPRTNFPMIFGALAFGIACIATAIASGPHPGSWGIVTFLWLVAILLLTAAGAQRAKEAGIVVLLRAFYWLLHFPAIVLMVRYFSGQGVPLTA